MAILVAGQRPVTITAVTNTTTDNGKTEVSPTGPAISPDRDNRKYEFAKNLVVEIKSGVYVDGMGLWFTATGADNTIDVVNNGTVALTQPANPAPPTPDPELSGYAFLVKGKGGDITYSGSGDIVSMLTLFGDALAIENLLAGNITVHDTGNLTGGATGGSGLSATTVNGDIAITTGGAIQGNFGIWLDTTGTGNITVTSSNLITAFGQAGIRAVAASGAIEINITAGSIEALLLGIDAGANGGVTVAISDGVSVFGGNAAGNVGVRLGGAGAKSITNEGVIRGFVGVESIGAGGMTLTNFGEIISINPAATKVAIQFGSGNDTLILDTIGTIAGTILGGSGSDTFRLIGSDAATFNANQIGAGFETIDKTGASTWTLNGTTSAFSGVTQISEGTLVLANEGAVGTGPAATNLIRFTAGGETLRLLAGATGADTTFDHFIDAFGSGDAIDLRGLAFTANTAATFSSGILTVNNGTSPVAFNLTNTVFTNFRVVGDGAGGTLVTGNEAPVAQNGSASGNEDAIIAGTAVATDTDNTAAQLSYSLVGVNGGAANGSVALNANGSFTYTPNTDFNGSDSFIFRASDGALLSNNATINITVNPVPDVPAITSNGGGATAAVSVAENKAAVTTVTATDVDGPALAFSINGGADAARFKINAATGVLSFKTAPNFEAPTDVGKNNGYVVAVRASDGSLFDQQTITVNVTNVAPVIVGSNGNNVLNGTGEEDTIRGLGGNDTLFGKLGPDNLQGGSGNDRLVGGLGKDTMTGGSGADDFDFNSVAEIGRGATRDIIKDFAHLIDDIDLSTIDANGAAPGHSFTFLATKGAAFTGTAGELRWFQQNLAGAANDRTIIEGDTNGNRVADFQIQLTGLKTLTTADFVL